LKSCSAKGTGVEMTSGNIIHATDRFRLFGPVASLEFDWPELEWTATHMPALKVAARLLQRNDRELQRTLREIDEAGALWETLEMLDQTQRHIAALDKMVLAALTRSCLVLERMGHY
jgi:hypothetical protein